MKDSPRHLVFIDYLRGIAILCVFLFHCVGNAYGGYYLPWSWFTRSFYVPWSFLVTLPFHYGFIGVPIFFVVSGFCIHLSFEQQGRDWRNFFLRRFFRIYPAYIVAVLIFSFFYANTRHDFWTQFVFHALLIHDFNSHTSRALGGPLWTLAIEAQLYLLYPLLMLLVGKFGWKKMLVCLAACEILLEAWDSVWEVLEGLISGYLGISELRLIMKVGWFVRDHLEPSPLAYWFSWSLGALAADAFLKGRPMPLAKSSTSFWAFLVIASYFLQPLWNHFFTLSALLTTRVIGSYLSRKDPVAGAPNFWMNHLQLIGFWSYSLYLLHGPLLEFLSKSLQHYYPGINPLLLFSSLIGAWLIIFPLAGLWYRVFEQPGIALGKNIIRKMADKKPAMPANATDS